MGKFIRNKNTSDLHGPDPTRPDPTRQTQKLPGGPISCSRGLALKQGRSVTGETLAAEPRGGGIEVIATARLQTGDLSQTLCRTRDNRAITLPRPLRVAKRVGAGVDITGLFCFVCLCLFS